MTFLYQKSRCLIEAFSLHLKHLLLFLPTTMYEGSLKVGYRAIDTAQSYFNEEEVGNAIQKSGIPREEIFLTTKVWIEHYGYEEAKKSVLESMCRTPN